MHAALEGHTDTVELLLSSGADVNAKENSGKLRQVIANIINYLKIVTNMLINLKRPFVQKKINFGLEFPNFSNSNFHHFVIHCLIP